MMVVLTQQDSEMIWWFNVPAYFGSVLSPVEAVTKGEPFKMLPIFNHYGTTPENRVSIICNGKILKPGGVEYVMLKDIQGYEGPAPGPCLVPSLGMAVVSFESKDPFGEYTITVLARDRVNNQAVEKNQKITLKPFEMSALPVTSQEWYFEYPVRPNRPRR